MLSTGLSVRPSVRPFVRYHLWTRYFTNEWKDSAANGHNYDPRGNGIKRASVIRGFRGIPRISFSVGFWGLLYLLLYLVYTNRCLYLVRALDTYRTGSVMIDTRDVRFKSFSSPRLRGIIWFWFLVSTYYIENKNYARIYGMALYGLFGFNRPLIIRLISLHNRKLKPLLRSS